MSDVQKPRAPGGLGVAGRRLWRTVVSDADSQEIDLDSRELTWLEDACRLTDRLEEMETVLTATGTVKQWQWSNPHTWLIMDVDDGKGGKVEWAMEGRAPGVLLRAGWSRSVLKPGDKVTVHYSPSKDGTKVGMIARVTMADGKVLPNAPPGD